MSFFDPLNNLKTLVVSLEKCNVLLRELDALQKNPNITNVEKLEEIKKIEDKMNKVRLEIDIVKNRITLQGNHRIN